MSKELELIINHIEKNKGNLIIGKKIENGTFRGRVLHDEKVIELGNVCLWYDTSLGWFFYSDEDKVYELQLKDYGRYWHVIGDDIDWLDLED